MQTIFANRPGDKINIAEQEAMRKLKEIQEKKNDNNNNNTVNFKTNTDDKNNSKKCLKNILLNKANLQLNNVV